MSHGTLNRRLGNVITDPSFNDKGPEERYCCLMNEIRKDPNAFVLFHRLTCDQFDYLRNQIEPHIDELPFSAAFSLSLTLRYLSRDDAIDVPLELFGVRLSDIQFIVAEVYVAIIEVLKPKVFTPITYEELKETVKHFNDIWNFPDCYGAVDFRSITCQYSTDGCSVQTRLYAPVGFISDAFCRFTCLYLFNTVKIVGGYETDTTGSLSLYPWSHTVRPLKIASRICHLQRQLLNDGYVSVGNTESNLTGDNMRPYDVATTIKEKLFNIRMARANSVVDNALGILFSRWRIFQWPLHIKDDTLEKTVECAVVLHNWLVAEDLAQDNFRRCYFPKNFFDVRGSHIEVVPGDWEKFSITAGVRRVKNSFPYETFVGESNRKRFALHFMREAFLFPLLQLLVNLAVRVNLIASLRPRKFMP